MTPFALKTLGFACLLVGAVAAPVRAVDLQTLVDRSPFAPGEQGEESAVAEPQGTWEFRGMATDAEGTAYSLFDSSTNKGRWVRAEDSEGPVQIKGFDPANNILEIEQEGRPLRLALKRAIIQSGQSVAEMTPPAPDRRALSIRRTGNRNQSQTAKLDPAAQQKRLQAVAETVRRTREQRQAAIAKARQNGQPAGAPVPSGS